MRRARLTAVLAAAMGAGLLAGPACRTPTEVTVSITTDVPCTKEAWKGIAVYVGTPGLDVETRAPSLTSTSCDAKGNVGSIVLVPSGSDDADIGVRVVAGVTRAPDDCATYGYDGCIVARRSLAFIPHQSLDLTIALQGACIGNACDALHTCLDGVCQDANLTPPASAADAGPTGPTVRCGDNGVTCGTSGEICCLEVTDGGTQGSCRLPASCPPTGIVLACDDESDCVGPPDDAGFPMQCCLSYTVQPGDNTYHANAVQLSQCLSDQRCVSFNGGLGLCEHRLGCNHGALPCMAADYALPGYFWCDLPPVPNALGNGP
jgi:hypothetical protein